MLYLSSLIFSDLHHHSPLRIPSLPSQPRPVATEVAVAVALSDLRIASGYSCAAAVSMLLWPPAESLVAVEGQLWIGQLLQYHHLIALQAAADGQRRYEPGLWSDYWPETSPD